MNPPTWGRTTIETMDQSSTSLASLKGLLPVSASQQASFLQGGRPELVVETGMMGILPV